MKNVLFLLFVLSLNVYSMDKPRVIKLGYIKASKRIDDYTKKFVAKLNEVIKEKNYIVESMPLPSIRDLHLSNSGQIHGALTRSNLVDNSSYPNLKMIETPVALMKYQLNKKEESKLEQADKKLSLVCIKDDRLCNGMLGKNFKVIEVNSHKAQSSMLKSDRADLIMRVHIKATGLKEEIIVPHMDEINLEYFNKPFVVNTYSFINNKKYPDVYKVLSEAYRKLSEINSIPNP